jgi:hypothetical protein
MVLGKYVKHIIRLLLECNRYGIAPERLFERHVIALDRDFVITPGTQTDLDLVHKPLDFLLKNEDRGRRHY